MAAIIQKAAKSAVAVLLFCALAVSAGAQEAPAAAPEKPAAEKKQDDKKPSKKQKKAKDKDLIAALPEKYRNWLDDVAPILGEGEKDLFLELEKDYQRDAFIERFWKARDPYPDTGRNEYRDDYQGRVREAREVLGGVKDDRARVLLTNGWPNERIEVRCAPWVVPTEVWYYQQSDTVRFEFLLIFYKMWGAGQFRLYEPFDGIQALSADQTPLNGRFIEDHCGESGRALLAALAFYQSQGGQLGTMSLMSRIVAPPQVLEKEWLATFSAYSTDLPPGTPTFEAKLEIDYPSRNQSRTVLQGNVLVPRTELGTTVLGSSESYNLLLTGEILREGQLFDGFRYKFDFPVNGAPDQLPLLFERSLRPGPYQLIYKVEDLASGKQHRTEQALEVPTVEVAPIQYDSETERILSEANAAISSGETTVKIPPLLGGWQTGMVRIEALTTGTNIAKMVFTLDDMPILIKNKAPWNVELDLGKTPRARILRLEAFDAAGKSLATDERVINAGDHRFAVRLSEPRPNKVYHKSLRAQAEIVVPKGDVVERVELYLNETLLATLYQPPWTLPVLLPEDGATAYVRAVAYRPDGSAAEDLVFINAPDLENVEVDFVELYTLVVDGNRPVQGLGQSDFTIFEDGARQEIVRFEKVENLPIHAGVLLDTSASMEGQLDGARRAALQFFERTIKPKDRAALMTFNDHPLLAAPFTSEISSIASALAGTKAERGTSLYDAVIFALYAFNGINGQKALVLLSDGKDESSRFGYDDMLDYARRSRVAIYPIGLALPKLDMEVRRKLNKLAEETGGRSFFLDQAAELDAAYQQIETELRSRYLLAYQSSNTSSSQAFRSIEVKTKPGLEAKTLRGYYP
jgi:Ca-activated chloride channel family protein